MLTNRYSWIIRLYRVKKPDNIGREHANAAAFEKGHKKKARKGGAGKRQARVLREE
jgi:dolichyl-diphosphooligosaccharide---protein glycosyltransferase